MKSFAFVMSFICISVFSCKQIRQENEPGFFLADSASFRISYSPFWSDTTAGLNELQMRAPNLEGKIDTILRNKLIRLGFMNKDTLILSAFQTVEDSSYIKNKSGDSLKIFFGTDNSTSAHIMHLKSASLNISTELNSPPNYNIAFADIIPGDYPEILLLENVYIMNGHNYYLKIYQANE